MTPKSKRGHNGKLFAGLTAQKRLVLLLLATTLTLIIIPFGGFVPDYYTPGDIASRDIKAPRSFLVPEPTLTAKKKQQAQQEVLPVYDYDSRPSLAVAHHLVQVLEELHRAIAAERAAASRVKPAATSDGEQGGAGAADSPVVNDAAAATVAVPAPPAEVDVRAMLGIDLSDEEVESIRLLATEELFVEHFKREIYRVLKHKIVGNLDLFLGQMHGAISVRDLARQSESVVVKTKDILGLDEAMLQLRHNLFGKQANSVLAKTLIKVVRKLLRPNLTFNQSATEARRRAAVEAVQPVLQQVKRGEMIVREGSRVTAEQVRKLRALRVSSGKEKIWRDMVGIFLAIILLFFSVHNFAKNNIRKYHPDVKDLVFLSTVFVVFFVMAKVGIFISTAMQSAFPYIDSACYYYILPYAAGAMLVRIVLNSEVAYIFSLLFALLIGQLFGNNLLITMYVLVGSVTAANWVRHSQARSKLYLAGLYLSLVNMLMVVAIFAMSDRVYDVQLLYRLGFAFVGGLACAVAVNGIIPLVESVFKYTTDFKLMELANMNTPILRELMIQAPGTYHHSIIVGNLVENAAEAIGANPLLARVAAYYHDIGKIKKPLYFAENMKLPENRHDKLAPSMSALILISHVKDGVEMAREHRLGQNIIDIIHQHHGTALIKFFYDKAQQRDKDSQVNEQDYRYPGPKPQTREAALIMLADSVEAAGRTLSEPTPARIQGMVQKIINKIFIDGQLDECELTLKDLHEIAKSFNRILSGIFHNRIDYPEPAYKERDKEPKKEQKKEQKKEPKRKNNDDLHRESAKEPPPVDAVVADGGDEDLKRLGMSREQ